MYQTTGTLTQCPGGWIPADKDGWPTDNNNLPCSFMNVTTRFGMQWNNPIVPFPQVVYPGSSYYPSQALDVYDCTLTQNFQQTWPCGFVPQWKVDSNQMQQLVLMTSDPIVSANQQEEAAAPEQTMTPAQEQTTQSTHEAATAPVSPEVRASGLMRSPVDLPLSEWSIPAPINLWFCSNWNRQ